MTIREYTASAMKFAKASEGWTQIDENGFYTTFEGSWENTSDNQNGGVGIEWAFHLTEDEIRERAPQKLLDYIESELLMAMSLGGDELRYSAEALAGLLKPGVYSASEIK